MFVRSISISREGDYGYGYIDASKPFRAKVKLTGNNGEVELLLSPELSQSILSIVADEFAAAGRQTAEAMTADIFTQAALPSK